MKIDKKLLAIGMLLLIAGVIAAAMSFDPLQILQYIFIGTYAIISVVAFAIREQAKSNFVRSKYYQWIGSIVFLLAVSLSIWGTTLVAFITVMGFFLLVLGIIEFVFAQQIFNYYTPEPWSLLGVKLLIATVTATGAAWILTMVRIDPHLSLLFLGVLVVVVGIAFMRLGVVTKHISKQLL
ncbi:MAG TPA: hypothetical protein VFZ52_02635 [Chryseolinea sp.]